MFNLFGGNCGCDDNSYSTILWFIILFLLLFLNCGGNNMGCGCDNNC